MILWQAAHTRTHARMDACTYSHAHARMHAHMHTHKRMHAHAHAHAHTRAHARARACERHTWARTCVLVRACTYASMAQAADPFLFAIPASKCLVVQPVTNSEISDQLATAT